MQVPPSIQRIRDHYIYPVAHHPVSKFVLTLSMGTVQIVAAAYFLKYMSKRFVYDGPSKYIAQRIYEMTVFAPVAEEILSRLIVLRGIHLLQYGWNYMRGNQLSEEDQKVQQVARVQLAAIFFSLTHLYEPHRNAKNLLIQCTWAYLGGVTYGYLSEKYGVASSILAHGSNNFIVCLAAFNPSLYSYHISALMLNKLGLFILAARGTQEPLYVGSSYVLRHCASLVNRVGYWNRQHAAATGVHP